MSPHRITTTALVALTLAACAPKRPEGMPPVGPQPAAAPEPTAATGKGALPQRDTTRMRTLPSP